MRFSIDVLFLDKDLCVIRAVKAIPPFRTAVVKKAVYVLELPVGSIEQSRTEPGDQIHIRATEKPATENHPAPVPVRSTV
jgi:uncharacterized membrane protein (UPF0127 family)